MDRALGRHRDQTPWSLRPAGKGKRKEAVLLYEASNKYEDKVRGQWIAAWGVTETKRLGHYDPLVKAGRHHLTRHITYDETREPAASDARTLPLGIFAQDVPRP